MILTANLSLNKVEYASGEDTFTTLYQANNNNSDIIDALMPSGVLAVHHGGTALATVASGSVLVANALDTLSALTSTSGTKMMVNTAGVLSFETATGTGAPVLAGSPTFTTQISVPKVIASDANGLSLFEDGGKGIFVQDSTGYVGIGTVTPNLQLRLDSSAYPNSIVFAHSVSNTPSIGMHIASDTAGYSPVFYSFHHGGTLVAQTATLANSVLGQYIFGGHDGTTANVQTARISVIAEQQYDTTHRHTAIVFSTAETGAYASRMRITSAGNVGINTTTPLARLAINGGLAVGEDADPGDNNLYVVGDCSALTFTDRTAFYEGDALSAIRNIKGDKNIIDHSSLPKFVQSSITLQKPIIKETEIIEDGEPVIKKETIGIEEVTENGRNIGNMVSMLTVAVQQLLSRIEVLEK